ncbi:HEAT repeat domain-containing protein, partial [Gammaproteobacteria bacterium]|nr:HEAT repeat domain-containing protein [Gammaproteobacteria bacterium]
SYSDSVINFENLFSNTFYKIKARQLATSSNKDKIYLASRFYYFGYDDIDRNNLSNFIKNDEGMLISINAAKAIIKYSDEALINTMITVFSKGRRIQQSIYSEIIETHNDNVCDIIKNRIFIESDIYVKLFCYKLLSRMKSDKQIIKSAYIDFKNSYIDLKIAVLFYIDHSDDPQKNKLIYSASYDEHWEIRAITAKLLGNILDNLSLKYLEKLLCDKEWWVRINSAISLKSKGTNGLNILEQQSPEKDKYAYDAAQKILLNN